MALHCLAALAQTLITSIYFFAGLSTILDYPRISQAKTESHIANYCQLLPTICVSTHTGHVVRVADSLAEEAVPDLPGEDAGTLSLVLRYLPHHAWRGHPRLGPPDGSGLD